MIIVFMGIHVVFMTVWVENSIFSSLADGE